MAPIAFGSKEKWGLVASFAMGGKGNMSNIILLYILVNAIEGDLEVW